MMFFPRTLFVAAVALVCPLKAWTSTHGARAVGRVQVGLEAVGPRAVCG